jgi:hypothetical protein
VKQTLEPLIEQAQNQEIHLFFMDAAYLVMGIFLGCLWSVKRIFVKSSDGFLCHQLCNRLKTFPSVGLDYKSRPTEDGFFLREDERTSEMRK